MSLPEGQDARFVPGRASGVEARNILGVRLAEDEARARFAAGPVVRLGTADGQGRPLVVVVTPGALTVNVHVLVPPDVYLCHV